MFVYLDNSSTTKPYDEVVQAMVKVMVEDFGNPSSMHKLGIKMEKEIKDARKTIEKALGAEEKSIYFTSGGTEANNLAIFGVVNKNKKRGGHIITTATEHASVLSSCRQLENQGFEVTYLPVDEMGLLSLETLKSAIRKDTILVAVMHANNETGCIQPIKEIGQYLKGIKPKPHFHVDGVQSFQKISFKVKGLYIDSMAISSHKVFGPKGIGALYLKKEARIQPLVFGGGQEQDIRPGTENVPGIIGFAKAVEITEGHKQSSIQKMAAMKLHLYNQLATIEDIRLNSFLETGGVPHILNISFGGIRGEVLLHMLEMEDIFVSTGSACSSNKNKSYSHVLESMGLTTVEKEGAIRFSLNHQLSNEEIEYAVAVVKAAVTDLRSIIKGRV